MKEKLNANLSKTEVKMQICKKRIIIAIVGIFLFAIPLGLKSQQYYYYFPQSNFTNFYTETDYFGNSESFYNPFNQLKYFKRPDNQYKKAKVEKMQINYQNPKKDEKSYLGVEINYDRNGKTTLYKTFNRKGETTFKNECVYTEKGFLLTNKTTKKNGKIGTWYENNIDKNGQIIESRSLNGNGSPIITRTYTYSDKYKVLENCSYKGSNKKLYNKIVNTYYSNGEIESTANYNGKGKLKKFWSYACSNKAEEVKNLKDTVKICKISDFDKDGNFTLTNISTGEDGMIYKNIKKYNRDSILLEAYSYNSKNLLTSKTTNTMTVAGWLCKVQNFTKGQQVIREYVYEYNNNMILKKSSQTFYKSNGKIRRKYEYTYDKNGLITDYKTYKKGGEQVYYSTEYQRNEDGLPLIVLSKNNKGELTYKSTYSYN